MPFISEQVGPGESRSLVTATRPAKARLARALLVVWAPVVLLVLSSLMTSHWVPLPTPNTQSERLRAGIAALEATTPNGPGRVPAADSWTIYHVLYAGCRCSRLVFDYLSERLPQGELREVVLLIGGEDEQLSAACQASGVACIELTQEQLENEFGIESAPLFVVVDPAGEPLYVGGYTDRKQGLDYRDLDIVARLRDGEQVTPLPVFGCGVSTSLQDALDPLGLKY